MNLWVSKGQSVYILQTQTVSRDSTVSVVMMMNIIYS